MTRLGIPVPPGFTITTEVCADYYDARQELPDGARRRRSRRPSAQVEQLTGKKFGDPSDPLLVSRPLGRRRLDAGHDEHDPQPRPDRRHASRAWPRRPATARFAYDSYRRLIHMFGDVVHGRRARALRARARRGSRSSRRRQARHRPRRPTTSRNSSSATRRVYKSARRRATSPQDPQRAARARDRGRLQARGTAEARHRVPPASNGSRGLNGTAVNVQAMVFGNMGDDSGTGVAFTRDPNTGENVFYGDFLINAQGEDVVAGIRTPEPIDRARRSRCPKVYEQLLEHQARSSRSTTRTCRTSSSRSRTARSTCSRRAPASAPAPPRCGSPCEMVKEKLIDEDDGRPARRPRQPRPAAATRSFDPKAKASRVAPGACRPRPAPPSGKVVFTAEEADERAAQAGETDHPGPQGDQPRGRRRHARGRGHPHRAPAARPATRPSSPAAGASRCVVGCDAIADRRRKRHRSRVDGQTRQGAATSSRIDGTTGDVMIGAGRRPSSPTHLRRLRHAHDVGRRVPHAQGPHQRRHARRTPRRPASSAPRASACAAPSTCSSTSERIVAMREMILADDDARRARRRWTKLAAVPARRLRRHLRGDGRPAGHDPPARPAAARVPAARRQGPGGAGQARSASTLEKVQGRASTQLHEANPMLGLRGCRLAIIYPEILDMQVRAIIEAAIEVQEEGHRGPARDHDPARRHGRGAGAACRSGPCDASPRRCMDEARASTVDVPGRHDDRGAARRARPPTRSPRRPSSSPSAPTT